MPKEKVANGEPKTVKASKKIDINSIKSAADKNFEQGNYAEAIEQYLNVVKADSKCADAWCALGLAYAKLGNITDSTECLGTAIELDPDNANYYFVSADIVYMAGDYMLAADLYGSGLLRNPEYAPAFLGIGNCYTNIGAFESAIVAYKQALELDPNYSEAANNLAVIENALASNVA